jgi:hypothetical protein
MGDKKQNVANLDKALAEAKAKAAARKAAAGQAVAASTASKAKVPADKDAAKAQREKERAEAKAKRDTEREARKAAKEAEKKPAHMSKVQKAAEKLPKLEKDAEDVFNDITTNLPAAQLAALALHIQHFNRAKATERAAGTKIEEGDEVEIVGGDPRFIGKVGEVVKAGRLRCHVEVEGLDKNVYCFTSDVVKVESNAGEKTGTDG